MLKKQASISHAQPSESSLCRFCLASLQHGNPRNAEDTLLAVRASPALAKNFARLREALEALRRPNGGDALDASSSDYYESSCCRLGAATAGRAPLPAAGLSSARVERAKLWRAAQRAREAAVQAEAEAAAERRAERSALGHSVDELEALLVRADAADAVRAAVRTASAGRSRPSPHAPATDEAFELPPSRSAARSILGKHILKFDCDELCGLLTELGLEASDLQRLRRAGTTGADLLDDIAAASAADPSLSALAARLGVSERRARTLKRLAAATALFDAVATRPAQPRLSEVELRLWLAGCGCGAGEAERVLRLLRGSVARDAEFVTYREWVVEWRWVVHAMEIYGLDWRGACSF